MPLNAIPIFSETAPRRPPGRILNMKLSKRDVVLAGLGAKRRHGSLGVRPKTVRSRAENGSAGGTQIAVKGARIVRNIVVNSYKTAERAHTCLSTPFAHT